MGLEKTVQAMLLQTLFRSGCITESPVMTTTATSRNVGAERGTPRGRACEWLIAELVTAGIRPSRHFYGAGPRRRASILCPTDS